MVELALKAYKVVEEEVLDILEPSRCTYEAKVVHPSACRQEDLHALERSEKATLMPHEEL